MNCDQAFDALTCRGASENEALANHLEACPRCRDMADVLSPALELFAPAALEEPAASAGETVEPSVSRSAASPTPEAADWIDSAPWRSNVQSARRARRDGLKIFGAVALVTLLSVGFASLGRDGSSGFLSSVSAAECIRESSEPIAAEKAVAACVSCHLQLTESQLAEPAQVKAEAAILKCVDCHMATGSEMQLASAKIACLFRPHGG